MTATKSVVEMLTDQHVHIKKLFAEVETATGPERARAFGELRRMLAVHEAAEEIVTHPSVKRHGNEDVVKDRLDEEHEAKRLLASLEDIDTDAAEFPGALAELKSKVLAHAENEEKFEFPLLLAGSAPEELQRMADAVQAAEKAAPTHPHPAAEESAAANTVLGPVVGLVDKVRDAAGAAMARDK
jgi:hemerythrin superfamily protein